MLEIGPADLAMDESKAAGLGASSGCGYPRTRRASLTRRTDGWPALLALATLGAGDARGRPHVDRRRL